MEIGSKAKDTGREFEWNFTKERYFFGFKTCAKDYIVYLTPLYILTDLTHFKPKERILKKVNLATDVIPEPSSAFD